MPLHSRGLLSRAAEGVRPLYYTLYRSGIRLACRTVDLQESLAGIRGFPPARLRFKIAESLSRRSFTDVGYACAHHVASLAGLAGFASRLERGPGRVLDFGCGCGRVLRQFLERRVSLGADCEFHGAEVDRDCLRWCRAHHAEACFLESQPLPPLPVPAGSFDLVYGVSVFTHLDLPAQRAWLAELHRILSPRGLAIFSVHGPNAARALLPVLRRQLDRDGFLFQRSRKLAGLVPDWYQTGWHTERFILAEARRLFPDVHYRTIPDGLQDFVLCAK